MIDFRFHLVSIVSIFLALAVGIVLGAGPLQGSIGTQLTDQVSVLRQEKDELRRQLDDANSTVKAQDQYAALVAPVALDGRLTGRSVTLLVTPDVAGRFSQNVQLALAQAGARVTAVVTLRDDYRDPAKAADRAATAAQAAALLGMAPAEDGNALTGGVLATVLVHPAGAPATAAPSGAAALGVLKDAKLVDYTQSPLERADLAVMLTGPISGSATSVTSQTVALLALATALSDQSAGLVVATGQPSTAIGQEVTTNLVTALRKDRSAATSMSSVDHADTVMGAGVVALTLARQWLGTSGHFGVAADAQAAVPQPAQ